MRKPIDLIRATRPVNIALTMVSVGIGFWFGTGNIHERALITAALSAAFICAGGNIFNDFYDLPADKINKPYRPYAAGSLSKREMISFGIILFASGFLLSLYLGAAGTVIAALTILLLMVYNIYAKSTVLSGNVIVSLLSGMAFVYGAAAAGDAAAGTVPAVFAGLYHFGREILKDVEDLRGDRRMRINTFPIRYGIRKALAAAAAAYSLLILLTPLPFVYLGYGMGYLITVILGVDVVIITAFVYGIRYKNAQNFKRTTVILKAGMFAGLAALLLK